MPIELSLVQKIAVWAIPVVFAITVHEAAHGYAARALGDRTAQMMGRLSLNPLRHIDPVGTVLVPLVLLLLHSPFIFGSAKPVPVDYRNLKKPRRDMALVAVAGPLANAAMAIAWGLLLKASLASGVDEGVWMALRYMAVAGIVTNLMLMVLNLLPLPPLDGGRVLNGLLPPRAAYRFSKIEPYGIIILLALLFTGVLGQIMFWPLALAEFALYSALGISPGGMLISGN